MQHHFVAAIVPPVGAPWHFLLTTRGNEYLLAATGPAQQLAPGASAHAAADAVRGPEAPGAARAGEPAARTS